MSTAIKLCIFDFDNTLVYTENAELNLIRRSLARNNNTASLEKFVMLHKNLFKIDLQFLYYLRQNFSELKLGVFSKAPIAYVNYMLNFCYPGFPWDSIVAYEHVGGHYKPDPYGIRMVMHKFGIVAPEQVLYIGDDKKDWMTAKNCNCNFLLFNLRNKEHCCQEILQILS